MTFLRQCRLVYILAISVFIISFFPGVSEAIPAFARKYNVTCTVCHTKPPRLNPFGEAFHMAGFQIPMTQGGEILKKRKIGRVYLEDSIANIFSLRVYGNFLESVQSEKNDSDFNFTFPQVAEIYLAGTFTQDISFFYTFEHEASEIEGEGNEYSVSPRFGLGKEGFLMFNLDKLAKRLFGGKGGHKEMKHGKGGMMSHGPMVMIGKIDPSTNYSYATNRQLLFEIPGKVDDGKIKRYALTPYAFASKFYGMKTGEGDALEVTKNVLYNTTGDLGIDIHGMFGSFLYQVGAMQGLQAGFNDVNQKKDYYFVGRYNFGTQNYFSGSLSGLYYIGNETGSVSTTAGSENRVLIDWLRYGVAGNIKYKLFDIYGAIMWDKIENLPQDTRAIFDDTASGFTIEADYIATDKLLLSARYDSLDAGGFIAEKENGKVMSLQARYYARDNFSLYLRDSFNLEDESANPLNSYTNITTFGADLDF